MEELSNEYHTKYLADRLAAEEVKRLKEVESGKAPFEPQLPKDVPAIYRHSWPKLAEGVRFQPVRHGERLTSARRQFWKEVRRNVPRQGIRIHKDGRVEKFMLPSPMSGRQLRKYRKFLHKHGS